MKRSKILKICIFFILVLIILESNISAFSIGGLTGSISDTGEIQTVGNKVIQIGSTIGSIVSVIVIIVLGIKYMLGSVEEKANYKSSMLPYLIGAVLVFAASSIASIVYNVAINIPK